MAESRNSVSSSSEEEDPVLSPNQINLLNELITYVHTLFSLPLHHSATENHQRAKYAKKVNTSQSKLSDYSIELNETFLARASYVECTPELQWYRFAKTIDMMLKVRIKELEVKIHARGKCDGQTWKMTGRLRKLREQMRHNPTGAEGIRVDLREYDIEPLV